MNQCRKNFLALSSYESPTYDAAEEARAPALPNPVLAELEEVVLSFDRFTFEFEFAAVEELGVAVSFDRLTFELEFVAVEELGVELDGFEVFALLAGLLV